MNSISESPGKFLAQINRAIHDAHAEARRDVMKRVVATFPLEERIVPNPVLDDVIAWNIGSHMQSRGWTKINKVISKYHREHVGMQGYKPRDENELWNEMGSCLLAMMNSYCSRNGLKPKIPIGSYVDLVY